MSQLPADITNVLRQLDEWQAPHTERNVVRAGGYVTPMDFGFQLPHDINAYSLSKFASTHIRDHQFGTSKVPLRMPILAKQTANDHKESVEISRAIVQYLFDSTFSADRRAVLASFVIQKGISNEAVRDEIYVQLCSQSMGIVSRAPGQPAESVWALMAACLSCFPPSQTLVKYLFKYVSDNGLAGYDIVCQHKLLHGQQQQYLKQDGPSSSLAASNSRIGLRQARVYPACMLEWKAAAAKGSMALTACFPDGEKVSGHVESWTTAEQFAAHLLSLRHISDSTNGWTVTLADDVDWFECPGDDFVLDLIAEIEVPPSFPCGTAYFLATTNSVRASTNRQRWTNQAHTADRLRLMPLEVDELPEPFNLSRSPSFIPPPLTPSGSVSPARSSPVPSESSRRTSDDLYISRDELLSQNSALNKRRDPTNIEQLSTSSALNSRYTGASAGGGSSVGSDGRKAVAVVQHQLPPPVAKPVRPELSTSSKLNERYKVVGGGGGNKPEPPVRTTPMRSPHSTNEAELIDTLFRSIDNNDDDHLGALRDPRALQQRMKGGGDNPPGSGQNGYTGYPPPPPPLLLSPAFSPPIAHVATDPGQLLQQQMLQQQLYQQQIPKQQTAELQAALHDQRLQNEVLQTSVQNELLKNQLVELQRRNTIVAASPLSPTLGLEAFSAPPPPAFASHPAAPVVTIKKGGAPLVSPAVVAGNKPVVAANGVGAKPVRGVTFGAAPASAGHVPPPAPPKPAVAAAENGHVPAAAAVVGGGILVMKAADASAADRGSIRRPPKKIGQIRWPPVSEEMAKPKEPPKDIGRIQIEEGKEENHLVSPRAPPEEIQRRINEMIRAAREADAAGEVPKKRPLPPKPFKAAGDVTSDMKARQEQLEMQLTSMRKKKLDEDNAAAAAAVAAGVLATTVRPPPGGLLPPPPPPLPDEGPSFAAAHQQLEERNRPPPAPRRESSHRQSVIASEIAFDLRSLDHKRTALYAQPTEPFLTYDRVPWTIEVRKEVFSPAEKLESPTLINMIFIQIVVDVANEDCIRIGKDDRVRMVNLLDRHGVNTRNVRAAHTAQVKRAVISAARTLPVYFCRLFAVNGGRRNQRVHMVGVGHSGVRLLNRFKDTFDDVINVLVHLKYEEISEVFVARKSTVLLRTTSGQNHVVYTPRAVQLCHMIETYRAESNTLRDVKGRKDGEMMLNLNNINDTMDDESFAD